MGRIAPRGMRKTAPRAQARKRKSAASARTPAGTGACLATRKGGIIARSASKVAESPAKTAKGVGCS